MPIEIQTDEIVRALLGDPRLGFRDAGDYLREGLCPACGHRELFVKKRMPWQVKCSRENKCGHAQATRELLPELFSNFSQRFKPTEKNPTATADAYLALGRGFDLARIRGWYGQHACQIPGSGEFCATIRFYLDGDRTRYWERLIDKTRKDGQKANFGGQRKPDRSLYRGDAWAPPGQVLEEGDRCFIVEGIFHAIALHHVGIKAIAAFSCNNFPFNVIAAHKGIRWVLALDGDPAGRKYMRRHAEKLGNIGEAVECCLLPDGKADWDDLYRAGRLDGKLIDECRYQGQLFLAKSVVEKAWHIYHRTRRDRFLVDYDNAIWNIGVDGIFEAEAGEQGLDIGNPDHLPRLMEVFRVNVTVERICNVLPHFLYMERDDILNEQRYVFQIAYKSGLAGHLVALEGSHLATPANFHQALLNFTRGGQFHGSAAAFRQLTHQWMDDRMLTVASIPFVGYDRDTKAWVFQKAAFHNGREIPINDHGYFEIGRTGIKSSLNGLSINTNGAFDPGWLPDFIEVFNLQGMVALAWWMGSLFAQQIRAMHGTWPFFELTGEAGAGKSTLLEFLWKCCGRDEYEGFDVMKSSVAGRRRSFNRVSNLPVVIIESDRDSGVKDAKVRQFDFDECKVLFQGRGTGTLGVARRNNDVEEHLFQGALAISQNAQVDGSEALLSRIVHCHADKAHHSFETREKARWFERQTSDTVGGFLRKALAHEKRILEIYAGAFKELEERYAAGGLRVLRVIKCHAQVAAVGRALPVLFPAMGEDLVERLIEYLYLRAKDREGRLSADHPLVAQFWETFHYLNNEIPKEAGWLNHSSDEAFIAVNLNEFRAACMDHGQELLDGRLLKRLLPESRAHRLVARARSVYSAKRLKAVCCWVFKK